MSRGGLDDTALIQANRAAMFFDGAVFPGWNVELLAMQCFLIGVRSF